MGNALAILQMITQGMIIGAQGWAIIQSAEGTDLTDAQKDAIIASRKDLMDESRKRDEDARRRLT